MGTISVLPIQIRIERTRRLLRMLEQDALLLDLRFASLAPERRQSARKFADQLAAITRAELEKLHAEDVMEEARVRATSDSLPAAAD